MYEFKKTEDQELLLESLKEVYERNDLDAYFKECDEKHEFPQKAIDVMVDAGFATLGIPEQYGGTEVDILTQCMVVEQACALGFPNLCWMNFACEVDDMLAFGSPEQQAETMKNAMTGTKPFSLGFTEPNAGSDNSAMSTRAEHRDGKVYINGQKTFITYADRVPYMLLMARNYENEIPQKDMSMYWLPMNTPGVKVTPLDKIGQHIHVASDGDKDEFKTALAELSVAVYEKCASLGGDIRGEYGIGYAKTAYLGEAACGEFKAAKAKLDPKGILNPGKVAD